MKLTFKIIVWSFIFGNILNFLKPVNFWLETCNPDGGVPQITGFPLLSKVSSLGSSLTWYVYLYDEFLNFIFWTAIAFFVVFLFQIILRKHKPVKRVVKWFFGALSFVILTFNIFLYANDIYEVERRFHRDYTNAGCEKAIQIISL